jgi:RNA polymerase sigma-70 factor (ECF subfamily)
MPTDSANARPGPPHEVEAPAEPAVPPGGASPSDIERLFREHNAALLRFIATKLGSTQEAREVAQEAYVRLLSLDRPEAVSYLRGFLFKTAANIAVDRLRQRSRRRTAHLADSVDLRVFELSPERQVASAQSLAVLRRALDELPSNCRQAFTLHRVHELSCEEITQRMGISERSVRLYVARAIQHLRMRLDESERNASEGASRDMKELP